MCAHVRENPLKLSSASSVETFINGLIRLLLLPLLLLLLLHYVSTMLNDSVATWWCGGYICSMTSNRGNLNLVKLSIPFRSMHGKWINNAIQSHNQPGQHTFLQCAVIFLHRTCPLFFLLSLHFPHHFKQLAFLFLYLKWILNPEFMWIIQKTLLRRATIQWIWISINACIVRGRVEYVCPQFHLA